MTKKILMVGVLDVPSSTNVFMKKGFEQLGYEVDVYNYRTRAKEIGSSVAMWGDFKFFLSDKREHLPYPAYRYDLIAFCKTNSMDPSLLDWAKEYGPTWYWFMDPIGTAHACMAQEYAKYATYASATSSKVLETFKKVNNNSFHIIEGYDPETYFYEDLEKIYDVTFIGNATPQRVDFILNLWKAIGNKGIHVFGSGWDAILDAKPPVFNKEERRVINQSKFILNLSHDGITFSDRVVKSLACGASVLSQYCKDLDDKFPGAVGMFNTAEEAAQLISQELNEKQETFALEIQKEMAARVTENYSWKAVCQQILEKVK